MEHVHLYGDDWKDPPVPKDRAFVLRTISELRLADNAARDEAGLPRRLIPLPPRGAMPRPERGVYRRLRGRCVGCGCASDAFTRGCRNCKARHDMRVHLAVNRLCRLIEAAYP